MFRNTPLRSDIVEGSSPKNNVIHQYMSNYEYTRVPRADDPPYVHNLVDTLKNHQNTRLALKAIFMNYFATQGLDQNVNRLRIVVNDEENTEFIEIRVTDGDQVPNGITYTFNDGVRSAETDWALITDESDED